MSLSIYSKASTDSLLLAKASLSGATFTGTVTAPNFTITAGSGGVLTFADGTTQSTAASGGGGGATWGSITGSISSQTDLQTEFGNYLPLAGGTLTGGLTVASAGITFSDASVQTSAAVAFTGGAISSPITYGNMTTDSYFGADLIGIELTGTSQNTLMQYSGLQVTDGSQTASFTLSGITFPDGTTQATSAANLLSSYLPLSGGTMTGAISSSFGTGTSLFTGNYVSANDTSGSQSIVFPWYFYTTNGTASSYYTPTYIQFADGTTQTTAASGGMDYNAACYAGITSALAINLVSFDGVNQWTFNWGSGALTSNVFNGNIGVTQDFSNFYPFDTVPSAGVFGASGLSFNSGSYVFLAFKDSAGTWHYNPSGVLYSP